MLSKMLYLIIFRKLKKTITSGHIHKVLTVKLPTLAATMPRAA